MMTDNSSLTWSAHLRIICQLYKLPDPLVLLSSPAWPSERWKSLVKISVTAHYESAWRSRAANNSRLGLLNVQTIGLSGRPHPVLSNILTTQEVMKSRIHIKMLAGDYPCQAFLYGDSTACRLCQLYSPTHPAPTEDMTHLLTRCRATSDTRARVIPDMLNDYHSISPLVLSWITHPTQFWLSLYLTPHHLTYQSLPVSLQITLHYLLFWHNVEISAFQFIKTG